MIERAAFDEALARIVAVDEAVEPAGVLGVPFEELAVRSEEQAADVADPLGRQRVRREEPRKGGALAGEVTHLLEGREEIDHPRGVVARFPRILDAQAVGLALVVPAELQEEELDADPGDARDLSERVAEGAADGQAHLDEDHLAHLPHAVTGIDVAELVPQDDGHLGFRAHQGEDAAGEIDVSARDGEGVDDGAVEDDEAIGQVGPVRPRGDRLAGRRDVGCEPRVDIGAVLVPDLDVGLVGRGRAPAVRR